MRISVLAACLSSALLAVPACATDFSFTGTFVNDNDKASFEFTVGSASSVTLLTYSYAGGVNSAGETIARGGFDPILSLYNSAGTLLGYNDDGAGSPPDAVTGRRYDTNFVLDLAPGSYTVYVTQYDNFGPTQLPGAFRYDDNPNFRGGFFDVAGDKRDGHWAFDLLNVDSASGPPSGGVPEPASWAMMLAGFGAIGGTMRSRRRTAVSFG